MWQVIVSGPNLETVRRSVPEGATLVLGRAEDSDIVLSDDRVSRRHAQISVSEHGVRIADLNTRNGTLLNGRALGRLARAVRGGDVATIGSFVVRVEDDGVGTARNPASHAPESFITLMSSNAA